MKIKERLERAGWVYLHTQCEDHEIYGRENTRIFYNAKTDCAYSYYNVPPGKRINVKKMTAFQLDLFCEKLP